MTMEDRIRFLLRAATRAEGEGDRRVASTLRRMAREALPLDPGTGHLDSAALGSSSE